MYTETELRDALQHSARRADKLSVDLLPGDAAGHLGAAANRSPRWRQLGLPVTVAAGVIALATASALLADSGTHHHHRGAAATPVHAPVEMSGAVDAIQVRAPGAVEYEIGGNGDAASSSGSETVRKALDPVRSIVVDVVAKSSAGFDASRIPRARTVQIDGRTGYYSLLKLYPLDANTGPGSDKYLAHWTIAFPAPSGDWVFASLEKANPGLDGTDVSVDDPAAIVAAYDDLRVAFTPGRSRIAFRTGYLPGGLSFADASVQTGLTEPGFQAVSLAAGGKSLDIELSTTASGRCANSDCGITASKQVDNVTLQVTGTGYDAATVHQVLDGITTAADLADPSTYWTLTDVFG